MNETVITGLQNELVKYAVKLQMPKYRKSEKMILLDGEKTIEGLLNQNIEIEYLFVNDNKNLKNTKNVKNLVIVNDKIFKKISTTKTPTQYVAIIKEPQYSFDLFLKMKKIALIGGIKDAGNLGTIIRSAVAFSIDGIILFGDCVDLYNTKTIRATAQNIFKIPIISVSDISLIKKLKSNHKLISTVVDSKNNFMNYQYDENIIIAFGSEASGLSKEILDISDDSLTFILDNDVESLNLGVCASICFAFMKNFGK